MTPEEREAVRLVNEHYQRVREAWGTPIAQRLEFNLIHPDAKVPTKGSPNAAGWDLYYVGEPKFLGTTVGTRILMVSTGVQVKIPEGYYGRVAPRSGMAALGIDVLGGVVDSDYRGEIMVILQNHGFADYLLEPGNRIAQLVVERTYNGPMNYHPYGQGVDWTKETDRGDKGFGSTGR